MEKASKILTLIFFLGLAYIAWSAFFYSPESQAESLIDNRFLVEGDSMLPALKSGDIVLFSQEKPEVGHILVFTCQSDRCLTEKGERFIKRVSEIRGDCYTLRGDNQDNSFDSKHYGELCGNEIEIEGVVTSIELSK